MKTKNLLWALILLPLPACFDSCQKPCDPTVQYPNPGACPVPGATPGTPGGACAENSFGDLTLCDNQSECYNGTCIPCGEPGQVCCMYGDAACFGGSTCTPTPDSYKTCKSDCAHAGEVCCPGNYCGPETSGCDLSTNTCGAGLDPSCNNSPVKPEWKIPVQDLYGCGDLLYFHADTYEQAVTCVEPTLNAGGLTVVVPPDALDDYYVCNSGDPNPDNSLTLYAISQEAAHNCAQKKCEYLCTTTDGMCP